MSPLAFVRYPRYSIGTSSVSSASCAISPLITAQSSSRPSPVSEENSTCCRRVGSRFPV